MKSKCVDTIGSLFLQRLFFTTILHKGDQSISLLFGPGSMEAM